ncbi:MAG: hypothetical protein JNK72_25710 [Myxococcales bacterium]|jgi:hypothetical protein|nr:hypothetical protein [Myxococcales bacterium]
MSDGKGYEFSAEHDALFAALGGALGRASLGLAALALLFVALSAEAWHSLWFNGPVGAFFGVLALAGVVLAMVLGHTAWSLSRARRSVLAVGQTTGHDVGHVLDAMRTLRDTLRRLEAAAVAVTALVVIAYLAHHGRHG